MKGPKPLFYTLQILAAIGFLMHVGSFISRDLSREEEIWVPVLYAVVLISALAWGLLVVRHSTIHKAWITLALVLTGLGSIGLMVLDSLNFKK